MGFMTESHDALIVIPSRYGSTRFPGKPLHDIAGKTLLQRVWQIAVASVGASKVMIATDDQRIEQHVQNFGAQVVMTSDSCRNGSERVAEALSLLGLSPKVVINLQGDAPLVPPAVITALIDEMFADLTVQISTPAVQLSHAQWESMKAEKQRGVTTGTTVVSDMNRNALYFTKEVIPFIRSKVEGGAVPVYQHIGLYAFRAESLKRFIQLPEGTLERVEQLEQLRALENGIDIRVVPVDLAGRTLWSVDNPEDIAKVTEIIEREGEIVL